MLGITKEKIKQTLAITRAKRKQQVCKVIELKIAYDHLNKTEKEQLRMFFLEAKWLYNYILSRDKNLFDYDYKKNPIQKMNKDKELEEITLKYLPAKLRYGVVKKITQNVKGLSASKKKGTKIGKLKFKSKYGAIDLDQHGQGFLIKNNRFKIVGIKRHLKVYGLDQIKPEYEFANAKLIKDPDGYFIKLTCYYFPKGEIKHVNKPDIGIDFGCKTAFTTSEGEKIHASIEESERLKRLQRAIAKSEKSSNNRYKLRLLLEKEYKHLSCKKDDTANKIVYDLRTRYGLIFIQNENLKGWQAGGHGKKVQHSVLGRVKSRLRMLKQVTIISRWEPTTKLCYICGIKNDIGPYNPIYRCQCGLVEDRDIKAAKTILKLGYIELGLVPMESREFKPVENLTSVSSNTSKLFSEKQETGFLISQ